MQPLPLHPAVVHVPLGLAVVLPLIAAGLTLALWRRWVAPRTFAIVVALQAMLVAVGLFALRTGEADEDRAEQVVAETAIEAHEHAAERFMVGATAALGLGVLSLLLARREALMRMSVMATTLATVATAALGMATGRAGGELVYTHGAAQAFNAQPATAADAPAEHEDDD